jgi:hypothetical protein
MYTVGGVFYICISNQLLLPVLNLPRLTRVQPSTADIHETYFFRIFLEKTFNYYFREFRILCKKIQGFCPSYVGHDHFFAKSCHFAIHTSPDAAY